ncbi:hypothetical protein A3A84_01955 [Candidatus Collierbacteria bacterium RIFCSPLOWO2_01_FULL_50_23]|uniref:Uncharacterized protein n=1 Tax=Candidatus Collierbacteria bacterium RIFCSPHIGHO2_01_FULL_50_25 TaxID=1817722 RepID=A0A1F5EY91_9BACT|nr:MAG: hypothetical protein A2703_01600 [Candidatus Collierbacteria bacterium RIFCSPHIGHO2_01_FULL_50_25]OGD73731.1 MAG: hypothetical protein A3A84_01955 [Candidatus Collierbacteria bacterium RIFCSPLOWO2_01_FULL_50_23]
MNIKEQESQLSLKLNLRIMVSMVAFLVLAGFMAYRLIETSRVPDISEVTANTSVPVLKLENFRTLQQSIKVASPVSVIPVVRSEPFD